MEPIREYRRAFGKGHWGGRKETPFSFYMTDVAAENWQAYGMEGTEPLDEKMRNRNTVKADWRANGERVTPVPMEHAS